MIFRNQITIAVLLTAVSQSAFANSLYAGIGVGVSDFADSQLITAPTAPEAAPTSHDYSGLGLLSSVITGYRFDLTKRFNLGLEAFLTGSNNQIGVDDISIDSANSGQPITAMKVSQRYTYGVRILPGYEIVPNVVGHAIVGVSRGVFSLIDNGANSQAKSNFGVYGYQLGLGASTVLLKNLDIRLDVIYTKYPNNHYTTTGQLPNSTSPAQTASYYDSLSSFDTVLSLTYRFNF